jgi:hypothetical protein
MQIVFLALTFTKIGQFSNLLTDLMEELQNQSHDVFVIAPIVDFREGSKMKMV